MLHAPHEVQGSSLLHYKSVALDIQTKTCLDFMDPDIRIVDGTLCFQSNSNRILFLFGGEIG